MDPVKRVLTPSETYGLLVLERGRATLGRLAGERVVPLESFESQVMGKTRAGGQSAQRFARERDRQKHEFFDQVAAAAESAFLSDVPVEGLLLGGTTITVDEFQAGEFLHHELRNRILGVYPVEYATEQGLSQLVEQADSVLDSAEQQRTREALERFFTALEYGAAEVLLVSETLSADEIRELEIATTEQGGECIVVPSGTDRGARFEADFGGIGALLRFPIN